MLSSRHTDKLPEMQFQRHPILNTCERRAYFKLHSNHFHISVACNSPYRSTKLPTLTTAIQEKITYAALIMSRLKPIPPYMIIYLYIWPRWSSGQHA